MKLYDEINDIELQIELLREIDGADHPLPQTELINLIKNGLHVPRGGLKTDVWHFRFQDALQTLRDYRWVQSSKQARQGDNALSITAEGRKYLAEFHPVSEPQPTTNRTNEKKKERLEAQQHILNQPILELLQDEQYYLRRPPKNLAVGKERLIKGIAARRGHPMFRKQLLTTYGACLVTGCQITNLLEATYIRSYLASGTWHVSNGLLLRADWHLLFDLGLWAVDTSIMSLIISPNLQTTPYYEYHGQILRLGERVLIPNQQALDEQRHEARL